MPQLDKFTFGPQVLWLIIIFFVMYFVILRTGLPRLYKVLVFRKQKIAFLNSSSLKLVEEVVFYNNNLNKLLVASISKLRLLPDSSFKLVENVLDITHLKEATYKERVRGIITLGHGLNYNTSRLNSSIILSKFTKN